MHRAGQQGYQHAVLLVRGPGVRGLQTVRLFVIVHHLDYASVVPSISQQHHKISPFAAKPVNCIAKPCNIYVNNLTGVPPDQYIFLMWQTAAGLVQPLLLMLSHSLSKQSKPCAAHSLDIIEFCFAKCNQLTTCVLAQR